MRLASDHPAEVRRFAAATVGPLVEHDARPDLVLDGTAPLQDSVAALEALLAARGVT